MHVDHTGADGRKNAKFADAIHFNISIGALMPPTARTYSY
jgi:hypothetical protein